MGDAADDALAAAEARREDALNGRATRRYRAEEEAAAGLLTLAPTCRCRPGDADPLCDLHGETCRDVCACVEEGAPREECPQHGRHVDPYGIPAPERRDPWIASYDPFTHPRL